MDMLKKLSLNAQLVLLGSIVYLILSFLPWVSVHINSLGTYTQNEWSGFAGVVSGLLVLLLLAWELARGFDLKVAIGSVPPPVVSVGLAAALLLFTIIKFFDTSFRGWAAWVGLVVGIGIGAAAFLRAKDEGVQMPSPASSGNGGAAA
jgi:hypothetical protein